MKGPQPWPVKLERYPDAAMVENRRAIWKAIKQAVKKYGDRDIRLRGSPGTMLQVKQPKPMSMWRRPRSTWTAEERARHEAFRFRQKMRSRVWHAEKEALDADLAVWRLPNRFGEFGPLETATERMQRERREKIARQQHRKLYAESERLRRIHEENARQAEEARRAAERQRIRDAIFDSMSPEEKALDAAIRQRMRKQSE